MLFFSSDGEDGFSLLLSRRKQNKSNYAAEAAHKFGRIFSVKARPCDALSSKAFRFAPLTKIGKRKAAGAGIKRN
jgi:hypothetical protein